MPSSTLPVLLAALPLAALAAETPAGPVLWYERPAAQWVEALPVGNGRLGAMVFGGISLERLQLNEDTLWAGGPYNPANPAARAALPEIRRLLAAGEYQAAQDLVQRSFMSLPLRQMPYQTAGDLLITMPGGHVATEYRRELDLDRAVATTRFRVGHVEHVREVFASAVDQVVVLRASARDVRGGNRTAPLALTLAFSSPQRASTEAANGNELVLRGRNGDAHGIPGALSFEARARIAAEGGTLSAEGDRVHVDGASAVTVLVAAATSYRRYDDVGGDPAAATAATLARAAARPYADLLADHVADHRRLFRRVSLDLGRNPDAERLPTDERVRRSGELRDPSLGALYFHYGRYLLIASSRPGTQPANLQGLWNDSLNPPWGSKYTININTQMNYWPAEVANLADCAEPLFSLVRDLSETGARLAREHYGARGWVAHHNTDLWRATGPIDSAFHGTWPTGGAWLSLHLWEHVLFSRDREFLARAYPLMRGAAEFFLDTLVEEPRHGWLVTSPSLSPENAHRRGVSLAAGPTMDNQILRDLFGACIQAATVLRTDADFAARLAAARDRLPPNRIGSGGQLQEWLEDWDARAPDQRHRHVSHLYGFFPSSQISLRTTPELAAAVRNTLETRGDISTGWAIAWRLNLWARLRDGERAHRILLALLGPERTYPNLFDAHPPFQIDGNFGGTAAIAEMLLQSHEPLRPGSGTDFEIELLPALPKAWPTGNVSGLRARGGFTVDLAWTEGTLTSATVRATPGGSARLRYRDAVHNLSLSPGEVVTWHGRH